MVGVGVWWLRDGRVGGKKLLYGKGEEGRGREGGREGGHWSMLVTCCLPLFTAGVNILANDKIKKNAFIIR